MRTVAIICKPQKPELFTILPELTGWLREHGCEPVLDQISGTYLPDAAIVPRDQLATTNPELAVVLGGDGTLLSAARAFAATGVPLLSVNLGSLGFLTEVPLAKLYPTLEGWYNNSCHIEERAMLRAELRRNGSAAHTWHALNDVVISKGAIARMAQFSICLDGSRVASYRADGIIVATPTGSTAYTLAANGPILAPNLKATVITPVCPHILTIRPLVVHGDAEVTITIEGIPDRTYVTIDGQEACPLRLGDAVVCRHSTQSVRLIRLEANGFFDVLRKKLKWGER